MKKISIVTSLILSAALSMPSLSDAATPNNAAKTTSYLLLARDSTTESDAINYLANTLVPEIQQGKIHTDRLVISFIDPSMNPTKIQQDINSNDLQQLVIDSGLLPSNTLQAGDAQTIKNALQNLSAQGVQVLFAVGGWAYSCKNPAKASSCASNFPMTQDLVNDYKAANLNTDQLANIQPISTLPTKAYTDAWVAAAKAFGAAGIDLDYEENWFAAETTYHYPLLTINPSWASNPNGPYVIPYSVIKYAHLIKSLKNSAAANNMAVTMAAPAAGAFDIHDNLGGSNFWCPIHDQWGNALCGQAPQLDQSSINFGGNLKGVLYDMAHYQEINAKTFQGKKYPFNYPDSLFSGLLDGVDAINVMTYDLDDGYDGVGSSWCIGKVNGQYSSRDPYTPGYQNVDCSITSQTQSIIEMYHDNVLNNISNKPHLGFGLEAGFANYPVNIDPSLPGGGNIGDGKDPSTDMHYRWNDPFIATSIPMMQPLGQDMNVLNTWLSNHQTSDNQQGLADNHSSFLIVNDDLFSKMQTAGADSMILWSLYNADYNDHLSKQSWDFQQYNIFNTQAFGKNYLQYGYDKNILNAIFSYAASPEDMLQIANGYYGK